MAYGFNTTFGTGTTDRIDLPSQTYDTTSTWSVWAYRNGAGGANFGTLWQDPGPRCILRNADASGVMQVQIQYDGTTGVWTFARPSTGVWAHLLFTHDGSAPTAPVCYLNGTSQTVTQTTGPVGTFVTTTTAMSLGNRASDNAVSWDGMIAEFARWNRILSIGEIVGLAGGLPAGRIFNGLVTYRPLDGRLWSPMSATLATTNGAPKAQGHPANVLRIGGARAVPYTTPTAATSTLVTAGRVPWRGAWRGMNRGVR